MFWKKINISKGSDKGLSIANKVSNMARDYKLLGNKSMVQLLKESGYLKHKSLVTKEKIISELHTDPSLIDQWELYSGDKRTPNGWYIDCKDEKWIVGYFNGHSSEKELVFTSEKEAIAVFIMNEMDDLAKSITD